MAQRVESNSLESAYAALLSHGLDGACEALRILVNEAAKIERAEYLGAQPHERSPGRRDYANGYKPKMLPTRLVSALLTEHDKEWMRGKIYLTMKP